MKVAFVTTLYPSSFQPAHGTFIRDQGRALIRAGVEVVVLHANLRSPRGQPHGSSSAPPSHEGRVDDWPEVFRWNGWSAWPRSVPALSHHAARVLLDRSTQSCGTPDIVHGHFSFGGGSAAVVVADRVGRPLVITEHSTEFARGRVVGWRRRAIERVARRAEALIAVSDDLAGRLQRTTGCNAKVIPNVVDVERFQPLERAPGRSEFHVVSVGSLTAKKGFDMLLHALSLLPARGWRATVVGSGPEREGLVSLASSLGIGERVHLPGALPRDEVLRVLGDADAFVSSSRYETFGIAVAEAMSMGVPVVVTASGGPESFVRRPYGLVVDPDASSIADGIGLVMAGTLRFDPREAHNRVASMFGFAAVADRIMNVYASLAGPSTMGATVRL